MRFSAKIRATKVPPPPCVSAFLVAGLGRSVTRRMLIAASRTTGSRLDIGERESIWTLAASLLDLDRE